MHKLVFFDTETTDINPPHIVEIALCWDDHQYQTGDCPPRGSWDRMVDHARCGAFEWTVGAAIYPADVCADTSTAVCRMGGGGGALARHR